MNLRTPPDTGVVATVEPGGDGDPSPDVRGDDDLVQLLLSRTPDVTGNGHGPAGRRTQRRPRVSVVVPAVNEAEIQAFVGALVAGAEFVKGTRFAQGAGTEDMTPLRRLGNKGLLWLVRLLFGGRFSDLCYGYVAFWKRVLPEIDPDSNGFAIETQ